jgi:hypothetical protein
MKIKTTVEPISIDASICDEHDRSLISIGKSLFDAHLNYRDGHPKVPGGYEHLERKPDWKDCDDHLRVFIDGFRHAFCFNHIKSTLKYSHRANPFYTITEHGVRTDQPLEDIWNTGFNCYEPDFFYDGLLNNCGPHSRQMFKDKCDRCNVGITNSCDDCH